MDPSAPRSLTVVAGGRKTLGSQMIRAMIEGRSADVRAIADRIAHRAPLQSVPTDAGEPADRDSPALPC
jgi:hypothetical protein